MLDPSTNCQTANAFVSSFCRYSGQLTGSYKGSEVLRSLAVLYRDSELFLDCEGSEVQAWAYWDHLQDYLEVISGDY